MTGTDTDKTRMRVRVEPSAAVLLAALFISGGASGAATLLAVAVHEGGHLLAARLLGVRIRLLELDVFGAKIYPVRALPSHTAEALLAGAGPLFSFLLYPISQLFPAPFSTLLGAVTIALGVFNLLPIAGFDGGRMLAGTASLILPAVVVERTVAVASYASLLFLWSLSACLLLRLGELPSLCILSATLFARLFIAEES